MKLRILGILVIVFIVVLWIRSRTHYTKQDIAGQYEMNGGFSRETSDFTSVNINADGTFMRYNGSEISSRGSWHLDTSQVLDVGIEFDGGEGSSSYADSFRLTRRNGIICWEERPDFDYWCKISK